MRLLSNYSRLKFFQPPTITDFNSRRFIRDCIKGLKLQGFSKLNFTYHGELRHRSRQPALDKGEKKSLVYCGSCIAAIVAIYI